MVTDNDSFGWFRQELLLIKSREFHVFDRLDDDDLRYTREGRAINVGGDYGLFLKEFGWAKLFADRNKDGPIVSVYPLKEFRRHVCKDGRAFLSFGCRGYQSVYFDELAVLHGKESKVFTVSNTKATEVYPSFCEWFFAAYSWARSKYSLRQWKMIVDGPLPFTEDEMKIVEARRLFKWDCVGFADNGDALLAIENNSAMTLPFLTIGVRDVQQRVLVGRVWLDVNSIGPGEKGVVMKDCYKDQIPQDQLELFACPDPIPEKRDEYWEFL